MKIRHMGLGLFKKMSLNKRAWMVVAVVVVGLVAMTVMSCVESRAQQMRDLYRTLQYEVNSAQSIAENYRQRALKGEFDQTEARKRAFAVIGSMRWNDGKGYVFAFDSNLVMRMHPKKPQKVGTTMSHDTGGENGQNHYALMVKADRAQGYGLTPYRLTMPDGKTVKEKISYSAWFKPWDLHFAAGSYFEDIDARFYHQLRSELMWAGALAFLVILVVWLSMYSIRLSLGGEPEFAVSMAARIADGDLNDDGGKRQPEPGSLIDALLRMRSRLTEIVREVQNSAQTVTSAAEEIAQGNDDLSQRTQEQASSLEETAASVEEITSTVKQNADNAGQADQLAKGARDQAEHGGDVAERAAQAMSEINDSSQRIADIVGLIDEIAFQTNLLALNAAVEAARAGDQGRGFAVVASEVRALAQRSATAAREIKALIAESVSRVENGTDLVAQSGVALRGIVDGVGKVTDIVAEIAAASQEQSRGIDEVNRAVTQIDDVTQQNAALVEQAAAAARAMQEQAQLLTRRMAFFRIGAGTDPVSQAPRPAPRTVPAAKPGHRLAAAPARKASPPAPVVQAHAAADAAVWEEF